MKLKYELKFSDEEVYILANFEKSHPFIGKSNPEDKITIDLKEAKLKDLMKTLEFYTGKEIIFQDEQLSNLKLTVNEKSIKWQDLLNKLSKEYGFEYKIEDGKILISKSPTL